MADGEITACVRFKIKAAILTIEAAILKIEAAILTDSCYATGHH
jgi:hypothetical protein